MTWVLSFIISWIVFFVLVDYKTLKRNVWAGIIALFLATFVDWYGMKLQLYTFRNLIIPWFGCSAFYKFGPILTMGIIFAQYVPKNKFHQIFHILAFTILFLIAELTIIQTPAADYIHWSLYASIMIDLLTFSSLTWITLVFIRNYKLV